MKPKFEVSTVKKNHDEVVKLRGEITFDTVLSLLNATHKLIKTSPRLIFDLSGVTRSDSAGLALMIDWFRRVRRSKREICFLNPPKQLLAIARVCGVDSFLPFKQQLKNDEDRTN